MTTQESATAHIIAGFEIWYASLSDHMREAQPKDLAYVAFMAGGTSALNILRSLSEDETN